MKPSSGASGSTGRPSSCIELRDVTVPMPMLRTFTALHSCNEQPRSCVPYLETCCARAESCLLPSKTDCFPLRPTLNKKPYPLQRRLACRFAGVQAGGIVPPVAIAAQVHIRVRGPLGCVNAVHHTCRHRQENEIQRSGRTRFRGVWWLVWLGCGNGYTHRASDCLMGHALVPLPLVSMAGYQCCLVSTPVHS